MVRSTYHHGDLRAVILTAAARLVAQRGADAVSLRELAREAGVSHAAPAHHFTDRRGLFTALAAEGFRLLAQALVEARPLFVDAATAYFGFAIGHPGHYAVMFDTSRLDNDDPELTAAAAAAAAELSAGVDSLTDPKALADPRGAQIAAWSLVHGFATLWLNHAFGAETSAQDPTVVVERIARLLFDG